MSFCVCARVCGCGCVGVGRGKGRCGLDLGLCLDLICSGTAEKDRKRQTGEEDSKSNILHAHHQQLQIKSSVFLKHFRHSALRCLMEHALISIHSYSEMHL